MYLKEGKRKTKRTKKKAKLLIAQWTQTPAGKKLGKT
jgi:predicted DNA-binding ArsR family transcriptional regulator